jgi:hypothetical protein
LAAARRVAKHQDVTVSKKKAADGASADGGW